MINNEKINIVEDKIVYQGFYHLRKIKLRFRKFSGQWSKPINRELFDRHAVASVLPYDPVRDEVVLIEQFRIGSMSWLYEIVSGILEKNEDPKEMAVRETKEEAGLDILDLRPMYRYWVSPGGSNEYLSLFIAKVDASNAGGIFGVAEEEEDIRAFSLPAEEAFKLLADGKIINAVSIVAIQWLQLQGENRKHIF